MYLFTTVSIIKKVMDVDADGIHFPIIRVAVEGCEM